jgi:hypothetical protein
MTRSRIQDEPTSGSRSDRIDDAYGARQALAGRSNTSVISRSVMR